ncbi:MAG: cytochrome c [Phycisphaerales bacterium]|nr:cytochrome c [Phycisphaerales bacterium]
MRRTATAMTMLASLVFLQGCGGEGDNADASSSEAAPAVDAAAFARARGKVVYNKTCLACHGENGVGVENLGKNWVVSEFIRESSDQELLEFIRAGRTIDDPMSAGNAPMPPSGGDPTLTDDELRNVIVFMRSLQD